MPLGHRPILLLSLPAILALAAAGCTPKIGDKCVLSTDCSIQGDRICDTSQPNGYCSQNCAGDGCPDKAACILFDTSLPGCGFNDRSGAFGSRVARSYCMKRCFSNSDCRTDEGYVCADPRGAPWNAIILDDDQSQKTCMVMPSEGLDGGSDASTEQAPVCGPQAPEPPPIDASKAPMEGEAGTVDAGIVDAGIADAPDGG